MTRSANVALTGAFVTAVALAGAPAALGQAIIHNTTTVKMGVDRYGQLNITGTVPSYVEGTTEVGLRYLISGIGGAESEATSHGCYCEGWGISATTPAFSAKANNAQGGATGLVSNSFVATGSPPNSAVADVSTTGGQLKIVHDFHPSLSPNLYEVTVTVTNTTFPPVTVTGIKYRRNMDWDIEPTAFDEYSTIDTYPVAGGPLPPNVLLVNDNGFSDSDPTVASTPVLSCGTPVFVDCGPYDHGALFDFDLGSLAPGASTTFNIYFGAAPDEPTARAALGVVNAQFYSFGQPDCATAPPGITCPVVADHGEPNTFIFAFGGAIFGGGCTTPPQNMVLWMPFDDAGGSTTANNVLHATANGALSGGAFLGPTGEVGRAVCFDEGQVDVPHYTALYLDNDMTMDAWVRVQAQGVAWQHTLVDKRQFSGTSWRGYWLYVNQTTPSAATGTLTLEFNDSAGATNVVTGPSIPLAGTTWNFVAARVRRNCGTSGTICVDLYVDNAQTSASYPGESGSIGTFAGLRVGNDVVASTSQAWMVGCVDELEVFSRALSDTEIGRIRGAGDRGKCKEFCLAEWDRSFYGSQSSIMVPMRVCNNTASYQSYLLTFVPATCPFSTGTPSPVGISANPIPPITVSPGDCSTVWLTIPRPPFVHIGDVSCYTVCIMNVETHETSCCEGSVQWAQDAIHTTSWPPMQRGDIVVAADADFGPVVVGPGGPLPLDMPIRIRAFGPDMETDTSAISLDGLPPGVPVEWRARAPVGGTDQIPLLVRMIEDDPNQPYWIVMEADLDGDGDFEQIESIALLGHLADPCAPAVKEDFEFHPPGPVCGIDGFIPWQGEADVCGEVSTEQASSGNRSLKIVGAVGGAGGLGDDTVLPVSGADAGEWDIRCMTFVPKGATGDGAIVMLNTYDNTLSPQSSWYSAQVRFRAGSGLVQADIGAGITPMIRGQWVELRIHVNFATDRASYFYNGVEFVHDRSWTDGVVAGQHGPARLRAFDFYGGEPASDGITAMYIDDVSVTPVCTLGGGADCNQNGVDDVTDIANGTSRDCYNSAKGAAGLPDGIPDECQCIADWNHDGTVNSTDVSDFINTYFADQVAGTAAGDINCDGVDNSTDVSDFINLWFSAQSGQLPYAGCSI
jgi:hypothetical protein